MSESPKKSSLPDLDEVKDFVGKLCSDVKKSVTEKANWVLEEIGAKPDYGLKKRVLLDILSKIKKKLYFFLVISTSVKYSRTL